ncbi:hypothetical protein [Ectopseudomonas mendocina]|uniref:hypothetical protein n=1 Tax=Ectopseudomonas mendocina TaxID=300 RepID=UPI0023EC32C6|nr:hypothetical protein [Pseudomonas mendocina]
MKHHITATLSILAFSAASSAVTSPLPTLILCTQDEYSRVGIEKINVPGSEAHLFEYGGKVTITKDGDKEKYSYLYGKGQDFYKVKDKTPYSNDFVNLQQDLFLVAGPGSADSSDFLFLKGQMEGSIFHIDLAKHRYYGYVPEFGAVNAYAGSCTILQK